MKQITLPSDFASEPLRTDYTARRHSQLSAARERKLTAENEDLQAQVDNLRAQVSSLASQVDFLSAVTKTLAERL